jgi:hypothetical protein
MPGKTKLLIPMLHSLQYGNMAWAFTTPLRLPNGDIIRYERACCDGVKRQSLTTQLKVIEVRWRIIELLSLRRKPKMALSARCRILKS